MAEFYSRWDLRRNLVIKLILFLSGPETPFPLGVFTNAGLHHAIGQWWIWGPDGRMADAGSVTQAPNTHWWPPLHPVRSLQCYCLGVQMQTCTFQTYSTHVISGHVCIHTRLLFICSMETEHCPICVNQTWYMRIYDNTVCKDLCSKSLLMMNLSALTSVIVMI